MNPKSLLTLVLSVVFAEISPTTSAAKDSGHPVVGTWFSEFIISAKDPLASNFHSWKELSHKYADGRANSIFRFYRNGRVVTEIVSHGHWGSDDKNSFWTKWDFYTENGVRHESPRRSDYVIEKIADGIMKYRSVTSARKYKDKRVSDSFTLP